MTFEFSVVPVDLVAGVIVSFFLTKGERTESNNYKSISLIVLARKIYARMLLCMIHRVTKDLIKNAKGVF